jgi:hypothetical protein
MVIEGMARPILDGSEFDPLGRSVCGTTMGGTDQRQDPVDRGSAGDGHMKYSLSQRERCGDIASVTTRVATAKHLI